MIHKAGLDLIAQEEGFRAHAYQDVAGVWTIGYGHTGGVRPGDYVTEAEARTLLEMDLQNAEFDVRRLTTAPLGELQFAALVSFVFNVGSGNYSRSTLRRLLNSGDYDGAAMEFRKWRRAGGEIQPGLLTRRSREEQLFRMPGQQPALADTPETVA